MKKNFGKYWNGQMARYYFLKDDMRHFYIFIFRSELTYKNLGMLLTSFHPKLREWARKKYNILNTK